MRLLKNLRLLRKRHSISQERIAELSGLDYKFYQAVEAGRRPNVTLATLDNIAEVYGVSGYQLIMARLPKTVISRKHEKRMANA